MFLNFEDARRGGNGETWEELRARVTTFLADTAKNHEGSRVATVTHGGSIKAFVGGVFGLDYRNNHTLLGNVTNTSVSQVVMLNSGPMVTSFNVAGHLED